MLYGTQKTTLLLKLSHDTCSSRGSKLKEGRVEGFSSAGQVVTHGLTDGTMHMTQCQETQFWGVQLFDIETHTVAGAAEPLFFKTWKWKFQPQKFIPDAWCRGAQNISEQSQLCELSGPTFGFTTQNLLYWVVTWRTSKNNKTVKIEGVGACPGQYGTYYGYAYKAKKILLLVLILLTRDNSKISCQTRQSSCIFCFWNPTHQQWHQTSRHWQLKCRGGRAWRQVVATIGHSDYFPRATTMDANYKDCSMDQVTMGA